MLTLIVSPALSENFTVILTYLLFWFLTFISFNLYSETNLNPESSRNLVPFPILTRHTALFSGNNKLEYLEFGSDPIYTTTNPLPIEKYPENIFSFPVIREHHDAYLFDNNFPNVAKIDDELAFSQIHPLHILLNIYICCFCSSCCFFGPIKKYQGLDHTYPLDKILAHNHAHVLIHLSTQPIDPNSCLT